MLSSTMVSVLAPHWSGQLRRTKRVEAPGNLEAQGNLQDVTHGSNTEPNCVREQFLETQNQYSMDTGLRDGSQDQLRAQFMGTRRNIVGCSTKSGPSGLDYESKRKVLQSVSLDVKSGRLDNREIDEGMFSPVATPPSPLSPFSLDSKEERRTPQTGHQGELSPSSSKPTTSSILLSLRRVNSNCKDSNLNPTHSEINPLSLTSSTSNQAGKLLTPQFSQSFLNNNGHERPLLSSSSISYRTTETAPILSPSSSNQREGGMSKRSILPTSPLNKERADTPFSQQPLTVKRTQSCLSHPEHTFLNKGLSEGQQNCRDSDKKENQLSESSEPSSTYDRSAFLKSQTLPRRTTLMSTSWWKQVTQEGSSPVSLNNITNSKYATNTLSNVPCNNNNSDLASQSLVDNKRFTSQILCNKDNNIIPDSVYKGKVNTAMKTQEGAHALRQKNAEDLPDRESDRLLKQQCGSTLYDKEPQKPQKLPSALSDSKFNKAATQPTLSHSTDLSKHDVSNGSFKAIVTKFTPTLINFKSPNTPIESSNKQNNHCTPKTSSSPTSPHSNRDSQKFTEQPLSTDVTSTLKSQALSPKSVLLSSNTITSSFPNSHPVSSQSSVSASLLSGPQMLSPKFTNRITTTPLGFERSYASIPKPFQPKTVSSLIPTTHVISKCSPEFITSTTPTTSSSTTGNTGGTTTAPRPSLLSPPSTSVTTSSVSTGTSSCLLTPPATPDITSPTYTETSHSPGDPKKKKGKKVRRVTWEDSVELQHSEATTVEKTDSSQVSVSPLCSSRPIRDTADTSIFSFLRSGSPAADMSHLSSPNPKTSSIQVWRGEKVRSLSSDFADQASREEGRAQIRPMDSSLRFTFDQGRDSIASRRERTLSLEVNLAASCYSSAPLSLPPDFSSGYKHRYSSPPYSALMSTRLTQGESKNVTHRSTLLQETSLPSKSNYISHLSLQNDTVDSSTLPISKRPLSPISSLQPQSQPFQKKVGSCESSKCGVSEINQVNCKHSNQDHQNGQMILVDNRVHFSSDSAPLQGDKASASLSTCVTETLVYRISKVNSAAAQNNTTPKPLMQLATKKQVSVESNFSQQSHIAPAKETGDKAHNLLNQSSSESSTKESQSLDDQCCNKRMKENVLGKSKLFSIQNSNEHSPKRSRFALKRSVSTPNSSLSANKETQFSEDKAKSETERTIKPNKMDQVLNKLKQTFSSRRSDDDLSFPWKWKRASQTPSVSGSSDTSDASTTVESNRTLEEGGQENGAVLFLNENEMESKDRWAQNTYTLTPSSALGNMTARHKFSTWLDESTAESNQQKQVLQKDKNAFVEHVPESKSQAFFRTQSPTTHHFDFYTENRAEYKPTNQFQSCKDASPSLSPNHPVDFPTHFKKSSSSPRSPFSPFSSLSPVSPFSSDVTDDSVFYSPKLQHRRETSSSCEPREGISLVDQRSRRTSTGPPSGGPGQDKDLLASHSSYADLKYGIEPGRSFSVSSVLSSRPSGPGRISTGSRFMSLSDLSYSALTCGGNDSDFDQCSVTSDWTTKCNYQPTSDCRVSSVSSKMRSRSLPRSLTRCLANWSSELTAPPPLSIKTTKPDHLWSYDSDIGHSMWDADGPPTPPPTPPLSPVTRRMSKPPSLSTPTSPNSPGALQDSQSTRGLLPTRGYVSSLSTFEESSDSSSDTTTDDEYYVETDEDEDRETEL
ncbi:hypothetical protein LDENG_00083080 [Lucifuga dentata]|nr:hypothetical protein LDENG_00083080 [Lucifuga dentata]